MIRSTRRSFAKKTLKNWKRVWKDELIESTNQAWRDLSGTINR